MAKADFVLGGGMLAQRSGIVETALQGNGFDGKDGAFKPVVGERMRICFFDGQSAVKRIPINGKSALYLRTAVF